MWVARMEWMLNEEEKPNGELVLALVQLGEQLGFSCTALLEGKERDAERSYLGFGSGWTITNDGQGLSPSGADNSNTGSPGDPLEKLRSFIQDAKRDWQLLPDIFHTENSRTDNLGKLEPSSAGKDGPFAPERTDLIQSLESGLIGYLDYEWGLWWQRPSSAKIRESGSLQQTASPSQSVRRSMRASFQSSPSC